MIDHTLYQEELLDHYRHPRNSGVLENAQYTTHMFNPSCGDQVSMQALMRDGSLEAIRFQGQGCVISQAAASLLTEVCIGKSLTALEALTKDDMLALVKISLGPTRLRCALLSLDALQELLKMHRASMSA